jgi:hypothetical protein
MIGHTTTHMDCMWQATTNPWHNGQLTIGANGAFLRLSPPTTCTWTTRLTNRWL